MPCFVRPPLPLMMPLLDVGAPSVVLYCMFPLKPAIVGVCGKSFKCPPAPFEGAFLIDDLLTFSRLSRVPLHKRTVDTARLVQDVLDDLASQRGVRVDHPAFPDPKIDNKMSVRK